MVMNWSGWTFVKQVLIKGGIKRLGVIVMLLIAKIKQTMHKLGISL